MRERVEEYRALPASPERDITMAIDSCVKTMISIVAIRLKQAVRQDLQVMHNFSVKNLKLPKLNFTELYEMVRKRNYQRVVRVLQTEEN